MLEPWNCSVSDCTARAGGHVDSARGIKVNLMVNPMNWTIGRNIQIRLYFVRVRGRTREVPLDDLVCSRWRSASWQAGDQFLAAVEQGFRSYAAVAIAVVEALALSRIPGMVQDR